MRARRERGMSLLIVIVIVLLTMLMAVWGARTALFNELIVGNDADYQRTFEAAQAMLQDAELDILGQAADGSACQPNNDATKGNFCRRTSSVWFVDEEKDVVGLLAALEARPNVPCLQGICAKRTGKQDFWNDAALLTQMRTVGARYGQFTGALKEELSNPILQNTAAGQGAWYWVEVLPYATSSSGLITNLSGAAKLELNLNPSVVYRITAVAQGLKPSTQVVLQATLARQKIKD
ncbi:MAG: pilus assembly protein [Comamonas sp.]